MPGALSAAPRLDPSQLHWELADADGKQLLRHVFIAVFEAGSEFIRAFRHVRLIPKNSLRSKQPHFK